METLIELFNFTLENEGILYVLLLFVGFEVMFQLKHWVCDYPLQNEYMLGKLTPNWGKPLLAHSGVHAIGTFLLVFMGLMSFDVEHKISIQVALFLALLDLKFHFIVDYCKSQPLNKWGPENKYFWWILGLDQLFHHVFNIIFTLIVVATILRF